MLNAWNENGGRASTLLEIRKSQKFLPDGTFASQTGKRVTVRAMISHSLIYIEKLFSNCLNPEDHPYFRDIHRLKVSSHLLIDREGEITQFVPFYKRAWHAGVSEFQGRQRCNDFSIGIELEGADHIPYTDSQYSVLAEVSRQIISHYPMITADRIVGHSDIAPGRKTDPGDAFDWQRYKQLLNS